MTDFRSELTANTIITAPIEAAPVTAVACHVLDKAARLDVPSNTCVTTCLAIQHALRCFGIESLVEAVAIGIDVGTEANVYGPGDGPWYEQDRFKGHAVLVIPSIGMLLDPTIGQFPEVRGAGLEEQPFLAKLPGEVPDLGGLPLEKPRKGHTLIYIPQPSARDAWRHTSLEEPEVAAGLARFGQGIACEVFDMFRQNRPQIISESPHMRIRELGAGLADATLLTDPNRGSRFVDASGAEVRFCDI